MSINPTQPTTAVPTTLTTGTATSGSTAATAPQPPLTQNEIKTLTDRLSQEDVPDSVKELFTTAINEIKGMPITENGELTAEQKQQIEASVKDINVSPEIKELLTQSLEPGEVEAADKKENASVNTGAQAKEQFHTVSYSPPKHKTLFQRIFNAIGDAAKSVGKFLGFEFNDNNKSKNYKSSTSPAKAVDFSKYKQPKASSEVASEAAPVVDGSKPNVEVDTDASGKLKDPAGGIVGTYTNPDNPLSHHPNVNPINGTNPNTEEEKEETTAN